MVETHDLFSEEGIDLFTEPTVSYLQVCHNGEFRSYTTQELFDTTRYSELHAITYVASPAYFFKYAHGFDKISLVLGIEENKVLDSFTMGLERITQSQKCIEFWNDLEPAIQKQVLEGKYEIRYANKGMPVHSKIYLLKGAKHGRVIIGR
jgi:hypothetical protein